MKNHVLILMVLLMLTACKAPLIQQKEHGKHFPIADHAWIEIQQKISVEPENARAYFQGGEWIKPSVLNLYQVNCEIEVRDVLETRQWIAPGKFKIIRTAQDQSPIVFMPGQTTILANFRDNSPTDIKRFWKFTLESKQQPNVMHLICRGVQDTPYDAKLPTSEEMQAAVGVNMDLHLF